MDADLRHKIKKVLKLYHNFSEASQNEIFKIAEPVKIKKGDIFIRNARRDSFEYILLEGICKSFLLSPDGEEVTISFFSDQSILSPHTTRIKNNISVLNFKALTDLVVIKLDATAFEEFMVINPEIREFGNAVLRKELAMKIAKETGLASLTAKERLLEFRKNYPLLENLIPHPDIASYLGITNVSLSRLRKEISH